MTAPFFSPSWCKIVTQLIQIRSFAETFCKALSGPLVEHLIWLLCSIDTYIRKHIWQVLAGYDLWPKSNQIAEYFSGRRFQEKLLLMEHLKQETHFYMLIYMLKHNINVKNLDGFRAGEKCSLALSAATNWCLAPALIFFTALAFPGLPSLSLNKNSRVQRGK